MPQFPSSKYSASPAAGTFIRAQGSHSPMVEAEIPTPETIKHPFQISARIESGELKVTVRAGTVNNIVPDIDGDKLNYVPPPTLTGTDLSTNTYYVYLKASKGASPVFFPDTCIATLTDSVEPDTNNDGYLLVGTITLTGTLGVNRRIGSIDQYVYASQVLVRAKPGDDTALWLWSSR